VRTNISTVNGTAACGGAGRSGQKRACDCASSGRNRPAETVTQQARDTGVLDVEWNSAPIVLANSDVQQKQPLRKQSGDFIYLWFRAHRRVLGLLSLPLAAISVHDLCLRRIRLQ
jgi:hypothetical protein